MDSINKNQPEENYKDLTGAEGTKKMKELIEKAATCFFCTNITSGQALTTRPMSVQKTDDEGILWFLSAADSHKNEEIGGDPMVQLLFQGSPHSDFLSLSGEASISQDKAMIKELWNPMLKTWFTEGEDDPRITVIKVVPEKGYYWDTKHAMAVAFVKRLVGAAIGKTLDDSVEGTITV
ncbi:MAG: pyridoxamine 5'-phosphate oxidase family protein [Ferruginibacter sp.]